MVQKMRSTQWIAELTEAVKGLVARGDGTDLKALSDQYTEEDLKADAHTTSTWSAYETARMRQTQS